MNILITGSNRGLGLELARQYAQDGWRVYATCRRPCLATALHALDDRFENLSIHPLDVTDAHELGALAAELRGEPIDVLYNNAGVYLEPTYQGPSLGSLRYDDWLHTLAVNTLGPMRVTETLVENVALSEKKLVAVQTSHMGSIADIETPGSYYYRSSKAALNAAMRALAEALLPRGIGVLLLHPGGVRTRMGPADGIAAEDSVRGLREVIAGFRIEDTGQFVRYDGSRMPW